MTVNGQQLHLYRQRDNSFVSSLILQAFTSDGHGLENESKKEKKLSVESEKTDLGKWMHKNCRVLISVEAHQTYSESDTVAKLNLNDS